MTREQVQRFENLISSNTNTHVRYEFKRNH